MPEKIRKSKDITNYVIKSVKEGLSVKQIFEGMQGRFVDAPNSTTTFYKYYKEDLDQARADIFGEIGSKVIQQAREGHFDSQKFFLQSRGGWSPQSTVTEVEAESTDDDLNAIDALAQALGKLEELQELDEEKS